jgi:hypothetical protein
MSEAMWLFPRARWVNLRAAARAFHPDDRLAKREPSGAIRRDAARVEDLAVRIEDGLGARPPIRVALDAGCQVRSSRSPSSRLVSG